MAEDDELTQPDFALPARAGAGTFLGLRPQDFVAMLGGILQGVPLGRGPISSQVRPFNALFPLAHGLEQSDRRARQQASVDALQGQYGGETDLPEFKTAILLANQGDFRGAMQLLGRGLGERNTRQREDRRTKREGSAAEAWGLAQGPVTELGRPALPESPQVGQEDDFVPAVAGTPDVTRPPDVGEIIARLQAIADPEVRGLAFKAGDSAIAARNLDESKLRPEEVVHGDSIFRKDPRRGTLDFQRAMPPKPVTGLQTAQTDAATARAERDRAQAKRADRDPNAPLGSKMNPHIKIEVVVDPADGVRKKMVVSNWVEANPNAADGVEHKTRMRPLGAYPFKPFAPRDATGGTKETIESVENVTPSRPITNMDSFKALQSGMQAVVDDVTSKMKGQGVDFTVPGSHVTLPSGAKIRKEDALAAAFKAQHGVEVTIRWDGTQFRIVTAKTIGTKENVQKRRVVGPAGTINQYDPQESDDAEED